MAVSLALDPCNLGAPTFVLDHPRRMLRAAQNTRLVTPLDKEFHIGI